MTPESPATVAADDGGFGSPEYCVFATDDRRRCPRVLRTTGQQGPSKGAAYLRIGYLYLAIQSLSRDYGRSGVRPCTAE